MINNLLINYVKDNEYKNFIRESIKSSKDEEPKKSCMLVANTQIRFLLKSVILFV